MELVSIIIPVYNAEKYISDCLESVMNQTYSHLEIILVNDGSTDDSKKICEMFAKSDNRFIIINQSNLGQASARNTGLNIAKGKYIAFVDSDDTIDSKMFENLVKLIQEYRCDIAICGHKTIYEKKDFHKNFGKYRIRSMNNDELWEEIFGKLNNAVWNKLFKRELLDNVQFPTNLVHGEDLIFNLKYLTKCRTGVFDETPYYNYLKRNNSITMSNFSEKKLMEITSKDTAFEIVKKYKRSQLKSALKFCFRARINVIRGIVRANLANEYSNEIQSFQNYIIHNYKNIYHDLKIKERIEYHLVTKFFNLYIKIIRRFFNSGY